MKHIIPKVLAILMAYLTASISMAHADDLEYIDRLFPHQNLIGDERTNHAAKCAWSGEGRCITAVTAQILRSFRQTGGPDPVLQKYNMGYFVNFADRIEAQIVGYKYNNYVKISAAIYYAHRNISNGSCSIDLAARYLNEVEPSRCPPKDKQCYEDMAYYIKNLQDYIREKC